MHMTNGELLDALVRFQEKLAAHQERKDKDPTVRQHQNSLARFPSEKNKVKSPIACSLELRQRLSKIILARVLAAIPLGRRNRHRPM